MFSLCKLFDILQLCFWSWWWGECLWQRWSCLEKFSWQGSGKSQLEAGAQTFSNKHWISCRVIRQRFDSRDNLKVSQLWLEQLDTATALVRQCTVSPKQQQLDDVSPKQRKSWKCVRCKSVARCWCILILPNIGIAKSCWLLNIVIGVDNQILVMALFVNYQYW